MCVKCPMRGRVLLALPQDNRPGFQQGIAKSGVDLASRPPVAYKIGKPCAVRRLRPQVLFVS